MGIIRFFRTLNKSMARLETKLGEKNKVVRQLGRFGVLRAVAFLLMVGILGGAGFWGYRIYEARFIKVNMKADDTSGSLLPIKHFPTVSTFASLNVTAPPTGSGEGLYGEPSSPFYIADPIKRAEAQEKEWQWEVNHYDAVITSLHLPGLISHNFQGSKLPYMLLDNLGNPLYYDDNPDPDVVHLVQTAESIQEVNNMHDFCVGTKGMTEDQFENGFLHYSTDTRYSNDTNLPDGGVTPGYGNGSATTKAEARIIRNDGGFGLYYMLNLNAGELNSDGSPKAPSCAWEWLNHITQGYLANADGVFIDEMLGGANLTFTKIGESGGNVLEYGAKKPAEFDQEYAQNQSDAIKFMRKHAKGGQDFIVLPNMGDYYELDQQIISQGSNGVFAERFVRENMKSPNGDAARWNWAKSVTDRGGYFVWSVESANLQRSDDPGHGFPNYTPSNYAGAKGMYNDPNDVKIIKYDGDGSEARHDMYGLASYLMAMDVNGHTLYDGQGAKPDWDTPNSGIWIKAQEMNIGMPKADYGMVVPGAQDSNQNPTDSAGQAVRIYRRDFDKAVVLFRTFWGRNDNNTNFGSESQSYLIDQSHKNDPENAQKYRVLFADGTLSSTPITTVSLALEEGVVLVPDGYDPMTGTDGGVTPPANHAKITLSDGGTHNVGDSFTISAQLTPNDNKICAATINVTYPTNIIRADKAELGTVYNLGSAPNIDNASGRVNASMGAAGCSTQNDTVLTIHFTAVGAGTAAVNLQDVEVRTGSDEDVAKIVPTDSQNTTTTINAVDNSGPVTTLSITNGLTANEAGYYTQYPIIKLTAQSPGATIFSITYQWNEKKPVTTNAASVDNIKIGGDGERILTYYAIDSLGKKETAKSQTFKVDTAIKPKPTIDLYNQVTYKSQMTLKGTKSKNVIKILVNDLTDGVALTPEGWEKTVDLSVIPGTGEDGKPKSMPTTFIVTGEDAAGRRNSADPVYITRHKLGDLNGDMTVGSTDLGGIMYNWHNLTNPLADLNEDKVCDLSDFALMMLHWTEW